MLQDPAIRTENVYDMDAMGIMSCMLGSIKVLGKDDLRSIEAQASSEQW